MGREIGTHCWFPAEEVMRVVGRAVRRTVYGVRPYRYGWGTVTEQPDP